MNMVKFGTPPRRRRITGQSARWHEAAQELRDNPGEWARIEMSYATASSASGKVTSIRRGDARGFEEGSFQAKYVEDDEDGRFYVWAMCEAVGGESDTGPADDVEASLEA